MINFSNYCRFIYSIKRKFNSSRYGELLIIYIILITLIVPSFGLAKNFVPFMKVYETYDEVPDVPHLEYVHYGNVSKEVILFNSSEIGYLYRLSISPALSSNLTSIFNESGIWLHLNGVGDINGFIDPPPRLSEVKFFAEIYVDKDVTMFLNLGNDYKSASLNIGKNMVEFVFYVNNSIDTIYDYKYFTIRFKSLNRLAEIFIKRFYVVAVSDNYVVPVKLNYFSLYGKKFGNSYIIEDGDSCYLIESILYIGLKFSEYEFVFIKYPVSIVYLETDKTIKEIFVAFDYFDYGGTVIKRNFFISNETGYVWNIFMPLYRVDLDVRYLNTQAQINLFEMFYYNGLSVNYLNWEIMHMFKHVYLLVLPGNYSAYLSVKGSFFDYSTLFKVSIIDENVTIHVEVNAINLGGLVLSVFGFYILLAFLIITISTLLVPFILPDTKYDYIRKWKNPLFHAIVLLILSAITPSLTIVESIKKINFTQVLLIIEFPLIILYKETRELVFNIDMNLFSIASLYSLIFAILWLFYPILKLHREINKSEIDTKSLKKAIKVSLASKFTYLSIPTILTILSPDTQIKSITPNIGLILYIISILLILNEIRKAKTYPISFF